MTPYQKKKLDRLFQIKVQELNKGLCELTMHPSQVVHHFVGRRNMATRWYLPNGVALTDAQHKLAHSGPEAFKIKMTLKRGKNWYTDLIQKSNLIAKYVQYERVLAYLDGGEYYL